MVSELIEEAEAGIAPYGVKGRRADGRPTSSRRQAVVGALRAANGRGARTGSSQARRTSSVSERSVVRGGRELFGRGTVVRPPDVSRLVGAETRSLGRPVAARTVERFVHTSSSQGMTRAVAVVGNGSRSPGSCRDERAATAPRKTRRGRCASTLIVIDRSRHNQPNRSIQGGPTEKVKGDDDPDRGGLGSNPRATRQ